MKSAILINLFIGINFNIIAQDSLKYYLDKDGKLSDKDSSIYEVNLWRQNSNDSIVHYKSVWIKTEMTFQKAIYKYYTKLDNLQDFEKFKRHSQALKHGDFESWYENGNIAYKCTYIEGILDTSKPFNEWTEDGEKIHVVADVMPVFPGGMVGLKDFIQNNVVYPPEARAKNLEEKIYVKFMIDKQGKVQNISVTKGQSQILIDAAIKVIEKMPKWKPGELGGKKVNVWYILQINYKL